MNDPRYYRPGSTGSTPQTSTGSSQATNSPIAGNPSQPTRPMPQATHQPETERRGLAEHEAQGTPTPKKDVETKGHVVDKIQELAATVPEKAKSMVEDIPSQVKERPFVAALIGGGVAFGIGLLVGSRFLRWVGVLGAGFAVAQIARGDTGKRLGALVRDGGEKLIKGMKTTKEGAST